MLADRGEVEKLAILAPIGDGGANTDPPCNVDPRHRGGANFCFADGHTHGS